MLFAGVVFALTGNLVLLILAAILGVLCPSGNEIGPFLSIEQAARAQIVPNDQHMRAFAWYTLAGSFPTAVGALVGGALAQTLQTAGVAPLDSSPS